jgi:hypothetical protein
MLNESDGASAKASDAKAEEEGLANGGGDEDDEDDEDDDEGEGDEDEHSNKPAAPPAVPPGLAMRNRFRNTPSTFSGQVSSWLGGLRNGLLMYAQDEDSGEVPDVVPIGY